MAIAISVGVAALIVPASAARAHHTSTPTGRPLETWANASATWLRLGAIATGQPGGGSLFSLELDGQVGFAERFAARMRVPLHWLRHDGGGERGPGDLTLGGEVLFDLGRVRLGVGVDLELPTGDADAGLGHGAVTLVPAGTARVDVGSGLRAVAQSSLLIDLTDAPDGVLDPVEQQDAVELRVAGGALWERTPVQAAGLLRLSLPLAADDGADGYVTGLLLGELAFGPRLRGSLFAEFPLGEDRRIDWRTGLALTVTFASADAFAPRSG
jgi:hypothetical protein